MKKMNRLIALLLALAMLLALAACGSSSSSDDSSDDTSDTTSTESSDTSDAEDAEEASDETASEESDEDEPVYGGTLTMIWREINNYFEPAMLTTYGYGSVWMESLWTIDLSSDNSYDGSYVTYDQLKGQIAESWDWDEENGTLTVTIRDDIYFQDKEPINGRQLVAEDVKYTYDRVLATGSGFTEPVETENDWTTELYMVESISTDGDYTVIFQFGEDYYNEIALNDFMVCFLMITSHEWDECDQTWEYAYGTGPYILTAYDADNKQLTFTKNENYYDYDERYPENKLPYLDEIILIQIDDTTERLSQFLSGGVEWLSSTSAVLSTSEIAQLTSTMSEDEYDMWSYELGRPYGILLRNDTEPFDDVNVRIAIQKAIPLEELHTGYFQYDYDMSIPGLWNASLTDWVWEWTDEVAEEYEYDPEAAEALLDAAGYTEDENGIRFEFDIVICTTVTDVDLYVAVQSYLAEIGVVMNITQISDIQEMLSINTDTTTTSAMNTTFGGFETLAAMVMITSETGSNYGLRHNSDEFESLIVDFNNATTMEERSVAAQGLDELFVTNHWVITLGGMSTYEEFTSSAIHGYQGTRIVTNNWLGHVLSHVWKVES